MNGKNTPSPHPHRLPRASAYAATASIAFVTVITILGEVQAPVKDWLKRSFTHHWLGKTWLSIIIFVVLFLSFMRLPMQDEARQTNRAIRLAFWTGALGALALAAFYLSEELQH